MQLFMQITGAASLLVFAAVVLHGSAIAAAEKAGEAWPAARRLARAVRVSDATMTVEFSALGLAALGLAAAQAWALLGPAGCG